MTTRNHHNVPLELATYQRLNGSVFMDMLCRLVHRLDKGTSGCLALAKHVDAATWLCQAFLPSPVNAQFAVEKVYWGFVVADRQLESRGRINSPVVVEGVNVPGETYYKVLGQAGELFWLELRPKTGRKHQLRQHCAFTLAAPVLGDTLYGKTRESPQVK